MSKCYALLLFVVNDGRQPATGSAFSRGYVVAQVVGRSTIQLDVQYYVSTSTITIVLLLINTPTSR